MRSLDMQIRMGYAEASCVPEGEGLGTAGPERLGGGRGLARSGHDREEGLGWSFRGSLGSRVLGRPVWESWGERFQTALHRREGPAVTGVLLAVLAWRELISVYAIVPLFATFLVF